MSRTIYLSGAIASNLTGASFILENSTLNEMYGVQGDSTEEFQKLQFFGVGLTEPTTVTDNTLSNLNSNNRRPIDINVKYPVPFLFVLEEDDYSSDDYRMRVPMNINGVSYVAYYLKKIKPQRESYSRITLDENNESVIEPLILNQLSLPNGNGLHNDHVIDTDIDDNVFVGYSSTVRMEVTSAEIQSMQNAINILYGGNATIDKNKLGEMCMFLARNGPTEASDVQAGIFLDIDKPLLPFTKIYDLGGLALLKEDGL